VYGLLWFCLALAPTAQVLPHHVHRADRFLYLPLAGLALAVAAGIRPLGALLRSRAAAGGAVALGLLVLVPLNLWSADQVQTWRDSLTMWENCVKICPNSGFAHDVLARNLRRRGILDRAEEHAQRSLELDFVDNPGALANRAMGLAVLPALGLPDRQEAVRIARRACELTRWEDSECLHALATAHSSVAKAQIETGQFASAADNLYKSLEADERCVDALFNLAILRMSCPEPGLRDAEEAVRLAERGCKALGQPTPDRLAVLAEAYAKADRLDLAVATAEEAIRIAQAAGDSKAVDELRRWVEAQRDRPPTQANGAGGEFETGPGPR
jgi:tetratricopeptide (TPR) repeat protein